MAIGNRVLAATGDIERCFVSIGHGQSRVGALAISVGSITIGGELGSEALLDESYLRLLRRPAHALFNPLIFTSGIWSQPLRPSAQASPARPLARA